MIRKTMSFIFGISAVLLLSGCMSMRKEQEHYRIPGIDIDQTLEVAANELERDGFGRVLTVWAIRDQVVSPEQADEIRRLYFRHIDELDSEFEIWHLTWAISNIYRQGNAAVQRALAGAYIDATRRAPAVSNVADTHVNGERLYRGDVHFLGRGYAHSHIVVPGNDRYLQSYEEYANERENDQN